MPEELTMKDVITKLDATNVELEELKRTYQETADYPVSTQIEYTDVLKEKAFEKAPFFRFLESKGQVLDNKAAYAGYFNVTEEERQNETDEVRHDYLGLPVTNTAAVFPLIACVWKVLKDNTFTYLYMSFILLCGILFILKFKVKKPGTKYIVFCAIAGVIVLLALIFG